MGALAILAVVLAIVVILIPVLLIWYINFGGIFAVLKTHRLKQARKAREVA